MIRCGMRERPMQHGLQAAGVPTVCTRYDGQIHLFYALPGLIDDGAKAVAQACDALKASFAGQAVAADN